MFQTDKMENQGVEYFTGPGINFRLCDCGMAIICIVKNLGNLNNNSRKTKGHRFNNCTELNNIKII